MQGRAGMQGRAKVQGRAVGQKSKADVQCRRAGVQGSRAGRCREGRHGQSNIVSASSEGTLQCAYILTTN